MRKCPVCGLPITNGQIACPQCDWHFLDISTMSPEQLHAYKTQIKKARREWESLMEDIEEIEELSPTRSHHIMGLVTTLLLILSIVGFIFYQRMEFQQRLAGSQPPVVEETVTHVPESLELPLSDQPFVSEETASFLTKQAAEESQVQQAEQLKTFEETQQQLTIAQTDLLKLQEEKVVLEQQIAEKQKFLANLQKNVQAEEQKLSKIKQSQQEAEQALQTLKPTHSQEFSAENSLLKNEDRAAISPTLFLQDYFSQLNQKQYGKSWEMLSPAFKYNQTFTFYQDWWNQVDRVEISNVKPQVLDNHSASIKARLRYYMKNGRLIDETHLLKLIVDEENPGHWLIHQEEIIR